MKCKLSNNDGNVIHCGIRETYSYRIHKQEHRNYYFSVLGRFIVAIKSAFSPLTLPFKTMEDAANQYPDSHFAMSFRKITVVPSKNLVTEIPDKNRITETLSENPVKADFNHIILDGSPISQIERIILLLFPYPNEDQCAVAVKKIAKILQDNPTVTVNDTLQWDWHNVTPLMGVAANGRSISCVTIMKEFNASPFIPDETKKNLLHLLVAKGHHGITEDGYKSEQEDQLPLFQLTLQHPDINKNINSQDVCGLTPLHYACARRDVYYIEALLKAGANPCIMDENNNDCFDILKLNEKTRVNILALALQRCLLDRNTNHLLDKDERALNQDYKVVNDENIYSIRCKQNNDVVEHVGTRDELISLYYTQSFHDVCTVPSRSSFNKDVEPLEQMLNMVKPKFKQKGNGVKG